MPVVNNDLYFNEEGDLVISSNKDLQDTGNNQYRSLIQGIRARLNFRQGEWPYKGSLIGANLSDFYGLPNTRETGELIKTRVINTLTSDDFISLKNLFVDVIPLTKNLINIKIDINVGNKIITYNSKFSLREDNAIDNKGSI